MSRNQKNDKSEINDEATCSRETEVMFACINDDFSKDNKN
jgi:hypothetical protein